LDFDIRNHGAIDIGGGLQIWINDTMVSTWIVMGVLIIFAIIVRIKVRKFKDVPTGFQNVIEALVEAFEGYLRSTVGDKLMFLGNWFFTVFVFVLISNLSGMIPGIRPPTADWSMTVSLAIASFVLIQVIGVKFRGREYIGSFFKPVFVFLPINLIGEIARPISLSFRLFGNILAGTIMMTMVYQLTPIFVHFVVPAFLHAYFDLFAGVLQTYIFCTLGLSFISSASEAPE